MHQLTLIQFTPPSFDVDDWKAKQRAAKEQHFAELNQNGPQAFVLIACSAKKTDHAARARDLYQGDLFKLSRDYAEKTSTPYFILSAFHELLSPYATVEPYNRSLDGMTKREREGWGARVLSSIRWNIPQGSTITLLAGNDYAEPIEHTLKAWGFIVNRPLQGLGIGQQRQKLGQMTGEIK